MAEGVDKVFNAFEALATIESDDIPEVRPSSSIIATDEDVNKHLQKQLEKRKAQDLQPIPTQSAKIEFKGGVKHRLEGKQLPNNPLKLDELRNSMLPTKAEQAGEILKIANKNRREKGWKTVPDDEPELEEVA